MPGIKWRKIWKNVFFCVRDSQGTLVSSHASVKERWRSYFHFQATHSLTSDLLPLICLFNHILNTGKWRLRFITSIYKRRCSVQHCGSYRGIKLMSHSTKSPSTGWLTSAKSVLSLSQDRALWMPFLPSEPFLYREKTKALHLAFLDV